ncbi:hypothetical protein [Amycolatopsis sp. PS_44_ISF1]|uniref:hypothetical protein n=1 Tax=Amycolatopsis sp. PS_44_ISF1 TaxID=2974917 RepID=UPI0028DFE282|nr:hypothetical protein [Amycolatopsis sp. PS_44_ISF1]MDT8916219.1 hypothetical protein [Amycolatopsis sp. PS_44_ISF1]
MGGIFEQAEQTVARRQARTQRWRALARVARVPVLAGLALVALLAWALSGWAMWPWVAGAGALIVLALLRIPRHLGPVWTAAGVLLVVDAVFAGWYVPPWWWAVLAGLVLTATATTIAVRGRLQTRRRETLGALALGVMLLAGGIVGLAVDAALEQAAADRDLQAAHDAAVPRILPRTPGAMVNFLADRLTYTAQAQHTHPATTTPTPTEQQWTADFCFVFSPAAQQQLAATYSGPDCPAAAGALARTIHDPLGYANNVWLPGNATSTLPGGLLQVDACHLDAPGPPLGVLTLQQQHGEGQLIIAVAPCG